MSIHYTISPQITHLFRFYAYVQLEEVARASLVNVAWQSGFGDKRVRTSTLRWCGMSCPMVCPALWASALKVGETQAALLARHYESRTRSSVDGNGDVASLRNVSTASKKASCDNALRGAAVARSLTDAALQFYLAAKRSRYVSSGNSVDPSDIEVHNAIDTAVAVSSSQEEVKDHLPRLSVGSWGGQNDEIMRDVGRTFPWVPFFAEPYEENELTSSGRGQRMLANVLRVRYKSIELSTSEIASYVKFCVLFKLRVGAFELEMRASLSSWSSRVCKNDSKRHRRALQCPSLRFLSLTFTLSLPYRTMLRLLQLLTQSLDTAKG